MDAEKEDINEKLTFDKSTKFDSSVHQKLLKRARKKYFTLTLVRNLLKLRSPLQRSYLHTIYCVHNLKLENGKITSKYCGHRWCLVCNSIRTAKIILKYAQQINDWKSDRTFVTLTIPNCNGSELGDTIEKMLNCFKKIVRRINDLKVNAMYEETKFINCLKDEFRYNRNKSRFYPFTFTGIRKLEVTYNPKENTFHPHFHVIVKNRAVGYLLISEWLNFYPSAESFCQDLVEGVRETSNNSTKVVDDNYTFELFKYFTKLISTESGKHKHNKSENNRKIYINALDILFRSVKNRRTFQGYNLNKANDEDTDIDDTIILDDISIGDGVVNYRWEKELNDWLDGTSGELLTGYEPSKAMKEMLQNGIEINETEVDNCE